MFASRPAPPPADSPRPQHTFSGRRRLFFSIIMVLLTLVVIEVGLKIIYALRDRAPVAQERASLSPYAGLDWPRELFAEQHRTRSRFVPFLMWRRQEFHGKHINVSPEGLRKTWNPPSAGDQKAKKVFVFGGSTTWGVGARDDFTVPSLLSQKLNQGTARYEVVNYGEKAYSNTQEVLNLVLLLKQGNIPDYVIFYDGINEVMVGTSNGEPGSFFGAANIRRKLVGQKKESLSLKGKIGKELGRTSIYRALEDLSHLARRKQAPEKVFTPQEGAAMNRLADAIVQDYSRNTELVRHLAQAYGFKYLFFWQPALCTNKALTPEEKKLEAWENKKMVKMYELVYDRMNRVKIDHFHNISSMFDQKKQTVFISWAHITEEGNGLVAERFLQVFQEEFPAAARH